MDVVECVGAGDTYGSLKQSFPSPHPASPAHSFSSPYPLLLSLPSSPASTLPLYIYRRPEQGKKIALLGFAYKPETSDCRESPAINIAKAMIAEGCNLAVYDPQVEAGVIVRALGDLPALQVLCIDGVFTYHIILGRYCAGEWGRGTSRTSVLVCS